MHPHECISHVCRTEDGGLRVRAVTSVASMARDICKVNNFAAVLKLYTSDILSYWPRMMRYTIRHWTLFGPSI